MTTPSRDSDNPFLRKLFPWISTSTNSLCFRVTYGVVLAGIAGLLAVAYVTGDPFYQHLAIALAIAGWLGQLAPLFPVGILSKALVLGIVCVAIDKPKAILNENLVAPQVQHSQNAETGPGPVPTP